VTTPRALVAALLTDNLPEGDRPVTGVRRILDNAADRALATRHAEAWYVATVLATAAASWALLTIARALTAASKETP